MIEVYKFLNGLSPPIMEHIFNIREYTYNVRNYRTFSTRNVKTHIDGTETVTYKTSQLWNLVPTEIKKVTILKDTVSLQMLYFLKIKIFISLDSCKFVEYLFKIKIYIFQFLKTKKGDNVSFVYFYKIINFV